MFAANPGVAASASNVRIDVEHGRVVLRGMVATEGDRQDLQARIASLPGVRGIDNHLGTGVR